MFLCACVCLFVTGHLLLTGATSFWRSSELLGLERDPWCGCHTAWAVSAVPVWQNALIYLLLRFRMRLEQISVWKAVVLNGLCTTLAKIWKCKIDFCFPGVLFAVAHAFWMDFYSCLFVPCWFRNTKSMNWNSCKWKFRGRVFSIIWHMLDVISNTKTKLKSL